MLYSLGFFKFSTNIHPYLHKTLSSRKYLPLKTFQQQTFQAITKNKNAFINSCTGSGKTLAYLLPLINNVLYKKEQNPQEYFEKSHGGIILTLNKQLCSQVYRQIRILDPDQLLKVKRLGPITHYISVISELSKAPTKQNQSDIVNEKIQENLANSISWKNTDVVVSTPQMLYNILSLRKKQKATPEFCIIDQADLLFELDRNLCQYTYKLLSQFRTRNPNLKIIFAASSFPNKITTNIKDEKRVNSVQYLNNYFGPIQFIDGIDKHKLPQKLELYYAQVTEQNKNSILKSIVAERYPKKIIIFCSKKQTIEEVCAVLKQQIPDLKPIPYHAGLDTNSRSQALYSFSTQDKTVLVGSDLASRGLDFFAVDAVIEYDMAENITNFLNRAGRTGRNSLPGQIITMVQKKNQAFFSHLKEIEQQGSQFDELFSRKRSYRKLTGKRNKQEQ